VELIGRCIDHVTPVTAASISWMHVADKGKNLVGGLPGSLRLDVAIPQLHLAAAPVRFMPAQFHTISLPPPPPHTHNFLAFLSRSLSSYYNQEMLLQLMPPLFAVDEPAFPLMQMARVVQKALVVRNSSIGFRSWEG